MRTFSLRFTDEEYDETAFQREMVARLESDHAEVVVSRGDIAAAFPAVIRHAERPLLRTAPAPLFLLSQLVHRTGVKVVLTGEGADEMFAATICSARPGFGGSGRASRDPDGVHCYSTSSIPTSRGLPCRPRRWRATSSAAISTRSTTRNSRTDRDGGRPKRSSGCSRWTCSVRWSAGPTIARLLADLPAELPSWDPLARDQYLEVRTLLSGYLLSSQGDRMAMGNSVEGRFPFLDADVVALASSLPPDYKLRVLDEKHVLKRVAAELVPRSIVRRPKQPYRAPDALSFTRSDAPPWVADALDPRAIADAGVFEPRAVAQLWAKCRAGAHQLSNADNMALVGVLSTQLLHRELVATAPVRAVTIQPTVVIDRMTT